MVNLLSFLRLPERLWLLRQAASLGQAHLAVTWVV